MKFNKIALATLLAVSSASAFAGDFTNVPFTDPATVVNGANNQAADPLYLDFTSISWAAGLEGLVANSISFNAAGGSGTLTLVAFTEYDDIELAGEEIGDLYDFVYRDSRDNKLVFGTRVLLEEEEEEEEEIAPFTVAAEEEEEEIELNFIYRTGFTGYQTSVAWGFLGDTDLRMYNAARTDDTELDAPFDGDEDFVRMQADISIEEGNPISGLYLVKTDAIAYTISSNGIGYFQAGEEGQTPTGEFISGYVAAVPEPETYGMLLAGLGLMGFVAARRK